MSELGLGVDDEQSSGNPRPKDRRGHRKGRGLSGCLAVLVALALLAGVAYFAISKGVEAISDRFGGPEDYPGPGTGQVLVEVQEGDTGADIGNTLKAKGVVKSVTAFTDAFAANPDSTGIQVGYYQLRKEMKASDAVELMVDPANLIENSVTIPEGLRLVDIVATLAKKTDFTKKQFNKVLDSPGKLGLPAYAEGNAEGYLFPATYAFAPTATPTSMLKAMVDRWRQAAEAADLEASAEALGRTPAELMTIASLIEAEGRGDDMPKISRVIYNRLDNPDNGITNGKLQIDATVSYALGKQLGVALTEEELDVDSPYNTRKYPGLPPGPIESPGDDAIDAAAHPADGDWLFYVTVNLKTGKTKFASTLEEFNTYKAEYLQYCETSDAC
ncbi:endolytic transglycosylase MltG [Nocardioides sp.]|uniref:endolytic transglycosylase MltG n=1 Tax=Nocardioides sp. TaxID=35761 RepID=UPI003D0BC9E5